MATISFEYMFFCYLHLSSIFFLKFDACKIDVLFNLLFFVVISLEVILKWLVP
jgi:hypothetical protein